ncbi:hypothetical protein [Sphingobacterium griseoflavum]|uniref:Resolvase/invertase-type recombinase catalytic domain-containing protein n=1 Tax=Sphingobacterium griseoflavum TaxID=1474952 RepID=A0ABQ3HST7_9SPHI|nr:hypothetical protein [Sphingobacterium griseoflavum]GHE31197.1 hypothetical protein GCM10017764_12860 [Sphingobacterium griseoflavum]
MTELALTKDIVKDLITRGYHLLVNGVRQKIEGDFWDYIKHLDEDACVLVLEDLLLWKDRELQLIALVA